MSCSIHAAVCTAPTPRSFDSSVLCFFNSAITVAPTRSSIAGFDGISEGKPSPLTTFALKSPEAPRLSSTRAADSSLAASSRDSRGSVSSASSFSCALSAVMKVASAPRQATAR